MEMIVCPNCGKLTGYKRAIGFGTFFAVLITFGLWLLALPLYPKRCIVCGLAKRDSVPWHKSWRGIALVAFGGLVVVGVHNWLGPRGASSEEAAPAVTTSSKPPGATGRSWLLQKPPSQTHQEKIQALLSRQEINNALLAGALRSIDSARAKYGDEYVEERLNEIYRDRDEITRALADEEVKGKNETPVTLPANEPSTSPPADSSWPRSTSPEPASQTDFVIAGVDSPTEERTRGKDIRAIRSFISSKLGEFDEINGGTVMYGHMTNSALPDAVVTYFVGYKGGNGYEEHLVVFSRRSGELVDSAHMEIGGKGRGTATVTAISNNTIYLDTLTKADSDPYCCPSIKGTARIVLSNGKLIQVSGDAIGN